MLRQEEMKRSGFLVRRKRMSPISRRGALRRAEYVRVLKEWMPLHPTCEVCPRIMAAGFTVRCTRVTTHPHHVKGRLGNNLLDTSTWLASCSGQGHPEWIHQTHKADAIRLGLLIQ
jgi:hypothetical protein